MGFLFPMQNRDCVGPQRPGCLAGRQPIFSTLHIMTAMASCMFILGPCWHHRWRNPRVVMPQQGQRPNGLLTCDVYRLAFGCFTRSLFRDQHLSRDWDHNVCKKWHCLSKSKSHDCHGPKNQRNKPRLYEESLRALQLWDVKMVKGELPTRRFGWGTLHPRLGEVVDSWRMRWHETTWDDGQTLQGLRPCPARRCESWTTCAAFHKKLSGDGQWNDKMMLFSCACHTFCFWVFVDAYLQAYHDVSCHVLKISLPYRVHTARKTVTLSRPARPLDELAKHSAQCLDCKGTNFASNFLGLMFCFQIIVIECHCCRTMALGISTGTECVVGALWSFWLLANIFDDGWCRRTFQLTLRVGQWRRMQVLSNVMGKFSVSQFIDVVLLFLRACIKTTPKPMDDLRLSKVLQIFACTTMTVTWVRRWHGGPYHNVSILHHKPDRVSSCGLAMALTSRWVKVPHVRLTATVTASTTTSLVPVSEQLPLKSRRPDAVVLRPAEPFAKLPPVPVSETW